MNNDLIRIINDMISSFRDGAIEGAGAYIACTFLDKIKSFIKDRDNFFEYLNNRLLKDLKDKEIVESERNILIPSIEGILLNEKETPLHEMFYNLLKSSIDKNTSNLVHPAFTQILKQMSSQEARGLLDVSNNYEIYRIYDAYCLNDYRINQIDIINKNNRKIIYKNNANLNYSYIFDRLKSLNLIYFEDSTINMPKLDVCINEYNYIVHDRVKLTSFGEYFIKVCYNDKCKELLEIIDIKNYFENILKK